MKPSIFFFILITFIILEGCGVKRQSEDFHMQTIADLTLSSENHPHGYQKTECFFCHLPQNIHQVDTIHAPSFNLAKPMVDAYGLSSCSGCHGRNGVQ